MKRMLAGALALGVGAPLILAQTTWHVATNGLDSNTGLDWNSPWLTISNAVGAAGAGDTILVSNGLYEIAAPIQLNDPVAVRSVNGPALTIVKRAGASYYRVFQTVNAAGALIAGFTITNGYLSSSDAGGVYLDGGVLSNCIIAGNAAPNNHGGGVGCMSGLVTDCMIFGNTAAYGAGAYCRTGLIANCRIEDNHAVQCGGAAELYYAARIAGSVLCGNEAVVGGGGIYIQNCTGSIDNCTVYSNAVSGTRGGGIYVNNCPVTIANCSIHDNSTGANDGKNYNGGGGIWASAPNTQMFLIRNCLIYNNFSDESGGGIYHYGSGDIENCTIVSNYAAYHSGVPYGGGGGVAFYSGNGMTGTLQNCIVQYNDCAYGASNWLFRSASSGTMNITNCCIGPGASASLFYALPPPYRGGGNFGDDPVFTDTNTPNWRLQSASPCVNAGLFQDWMKNAVDLDGRRRLDWGGGAVDLGCYEFVPAGMLLHIR